MILCSLKHLHDPKQKYMHVLVNISLSFPFLLKTYFIFMSMGALPTCVSVQHMHAVSKEPRRKCQISWTWSQRQL